MHHVHLITHPIILSNALSITHQLLHYRVSIMLQATRVLAAYTGRGGGIIVRRGIKPTLSSSSSPSSTLSSSYISSRRLDGGINHIIGRHRLFSSSTSTAPSLDVIITNACVKVSASSSSAMSSSSLFATLHNLCVCALHIHHNSVSRLYKARVGSLSSNFD